MASSGVNKVIIVGNLGQNPEVKYMPNGNAVTNISVATSESWKDQQGQLQERTEWHRIVMFRKLAEIAGQYLQKGSKVYLEGKLQTRKWQDQNGNDRYTTEIVADQMQMLDRRGGQEGGFQGQGQGMSGGAPQQAPQQPSYQQMPGQNTPVQSQSPAQNPAPVQNQSAPMSSPVQNKGQSNQPMGSNPGGFNQAPQQPAQPMQEPDFDFDDDIPF